MAEVRMITEEDILNAESYVPLKDKSIYSRAIANLCVVDMTVSMMDGEKEIPLPTMAREDPQMKMMYGLWAMLRFYLKFITDEEITSDQYDEWGRVSIFNQIERFKSSKNIEVRNKAYDILDDYREFYRMIGCEINSRLVARNDLLPRIIQVLEKQATPDAIKSLSDELKTAVEQLEEYKAKKSENK